MALVDNGDGTFRVDQSSLRYAHESMRLLNAAPDLLKALKDILALAKDIHDPRVSASINYSGMDAAEAAIAKATGENK